MSRVMTAVSLVVSFAGGVMAQTPEQDVLKGEQARVEARHKADSTAHAKIVSDDFFQVSNDGQTHDKKYAVSLQASPGMSLRELKTQIFGDVVVVTGIQTATPPASDARFTHLWHKENGQWLNVFVQNTPIRQLPETANATAAVPPTNWPQGKTQDE